MVHSFACFFFPPSLLAPALVPSPCGDPEYLCLTPTTRTQLCGGRNVGGESSIRLARCNDPSLPAVSRFSQCAAFLLIFWRWRASVFVRRSESVHSPHVARTQPFAKGNLSLSSTSLSLFLNTIQKMVANVSSPRRRWNTFYSVLQKTKN